MFSGRAWCLTGFGEPADVIRLRDTVLAEPDPGRILIRVAAAGAGYPDSMMTAGRFPLLGAPPFGLGTEAAGSVVAVPAGSRFAVGDRVTGITAFLEGWGGYAEYTFLLESSTVLIPEAMSEQDAAGFPVAFRTAYAGLVERTRVQPGETLAVLGAAGSAGGGAVQLGKALGARVIAVAGGRQKVEFCRRHGAHEAIDHRSEDVAARLTELTGGRGVDVLYDPVGGETAGKALTALARGGRIVLIGFASGALVDMNARYLLYGNHSAIGVLAGPGRPEKEAPAWRHLARLAAEGLIRTPLGPIHDFADVPLVVARQAAPPPGKCVVRVAPAAGHAA